MGKVYDRIDEYLRDWIGRQSLFFVGTAPLAGDGRVNVSPKGPIGALRVLDDRTVAYLEPDNPPVGISEATSANPEAAEALGLLLADLDALHLSSARALPAEGEQRLDRVGLALEDRLDRAVGPVADPAGDAARGRLAAGRVAEEDPLNAAVDGRSPADG